MKINLLTILLVGAVVAVSAFVIMSGWTRAASQASGQPSASSAPVLLGTPAAADRLNPAGVFQFPTETPTPTLLYSTFERIGPIDDCGEVRGGAGLHKNETLEASFRAKPCPAEDGTSASETPNPAVLTLEQDYPCYLGPGSQYGTVNTLKAGTQLQIVGYGFGGGWLVGLLPTQPGFHCWIDESFVSLTVPVERLRIISIPPEPTSTPRPTRQPTTCYYNNLQQLVCQ